MNKIEVNCTDGDYLLIRVSNDVGTLMNYNSNRFSEVLAQAGYVVVPRGGGYRVRGIINTHIATLLTEARVDNYRLDGVDYTTCYRDSGMEVVAVLQHHYDYEVDVDTGTCVKRLPEGMAECTRCGRVVPRGEVCATLCDECYSLYTMRYGYHDYAGGYNVVDKHIDTTNTPVFGVEIEQDYRGLGAFWADYDHASRGACNILYASEIKANKPISARKAVFMSDGSLTNGGVEWITMPASYVNYKRRVAEFDAVFKEWRDNNFYAGGNAGLHVHINRDFFNACGDTRYYGAKMAVIISRLWREFMAISGRTNASDYARKPLESADGDALKIALEYMDKVDMHSVALNSQHVYTFEVRLWGAVGSAEQLVFAIDWTQALGKYAKRCSLERCQRATLADLARYLSDKHEHITEAIARLKAHHLAVDKLEAMLTKGGNK